MNEERGSHLFSEAIRSLEDGNLDRAEALFIDVLDNLEKRHHHAILSLKSLVTISTDRGDFDTAIDWSLRLLDAQTGALGHTHADVSRTVMNIATMCETQGRPDIAREVKELHQYALAAERATKAQQVKTLRESRKTVEDETPDEADYDVTRLTLQELVAKSTHNFYEKIDTGKAPYVSMIFLGVLGILFVVIFALKLCYSTEHNELLSSSQPRFSAADDRIKIQFVTPRIAEVTIDDKRKLKLPFSCYGYNAIEIADLLMLLPTENEYWLKRTPDGLIDRAGTEFFSETHTDREILALMASLQVSADSYYKRNKLYPDSLKQLGDFTYRNPYTKRMDYPLMQSVDIPGRLSPDKYLQTLKRGALWEDEPILYPGCVNICHLSRKTNSSVPESLVIQGCNKQGRFFHKSDGSPYVVVCERGLPEKTLPLTVFDRTGRICLLDIHPAWASLVLLLIMCRHGIFFSLLGAAFFSLSGRFAGDTPKRVAIGIGALLFGLGAVCLVLAWI